MIQIAFTHHDGGEDDNQAQKNELQKQVLLLTESVEKIHKKIPTTLIEKECRFDNNARVSSKIARLLNDRYVLHKKIDDHST